MYQDDEIKYICGYGQSKCFHYFFSYKDYPYAVYTCIEAVYKYLSSLRASLVAQKFVKCVRSIL